MPVSPPNAGSSRDRFFDADAGRAAIVAGEDIRILYADIDLHFINQTATLMPQLIGGVGDVTFFGPGFVSEAVLKRGILDYCDRTGP